MVNSTADNPEPDRTARRADVACLPSPARKQALVKRDPALAARHVSAGLLIFSSYCVLIILGLTLRWHLQSWGLLLAAWQREALLLTGGIHVVGSAGSLLLLLQNRRGGLAHPLAPKLLLAVMPLAVLASVDRLLTIGYVPPSADHAHVNHPRRGWTFRPGWVGSFLGAEMRVNSKGLPGPEVPYEKQEGEYRLLFLGDSVTAGYGVKNEDGFVNLLRNRISQEKHDRRFTTINASVVSYSPWQQVDLLKTEGLKYDPDVVVEVFCLNDYVEKFQLEAFGGKSRGPRIGSPTLARSGVYRLIHWELLADRLRQSRQEAEQSVFYSVARLLAEPDHPDFEKVWRITHQNVRRMIEVASQAGRPFVIVCVPFRIQLEQGAPKNPIPQARLASVAREAGADFLDLLPVFRRYAHEHGLESSDLFLDVCHPNRLGHAVAADAIHTFLARHGLLPE